MTAFNKKKQRFKPVNILIITIAKFESLSPQNNSIVISWILQWQPLMFIR